MTAYAEFVRRALRHTDDVAEAMIAADLALGLQAEFAIPGNIEYGEVAPGPGWVYIGEGERGGKKWEFQGEPGQQEQAAQQQPVQQAPTPGKWTPDEYRLDQFLASTGKGMTIKQIERSTGMKGNQVADALAGLNQKGKIAFGTGRSGPTYARKSSEQEVVQEEPVIKTPRQLAEELPRQAASPSESVLQSMTRILQDDSAHSQGMMSLYRIRKELANKYGLADREQVDDALRQLRRDGKIRLIFASRVHQEGDAKDITVHKDTPEELVEGSIRVPAADPNMPDSLIAYAELVPEDVALSHRSAPSEGVVGEVLGQNRLPLINGFTPPTLPPGEFGYVKLDDGSIGWAGQWPPGDGWAMAYKGPKGGNFWRRTNQQTTEQSPQPPPQKQPTAKEPSAAQKSPIPQHAQPVSNMMQKALATDSKLSPEQKKAYQAATDGVLSAMPEVAQQRVAASLKKVSLFGTTQELTQDLVARHPESDKLKRVLANGSVVGGSFYPKTGEWLADGDVGLTGDFSQEGRSNVHETYAHELTHAIDGPELEFSSSKEWQMAYDAELRGGNLSQYASTSAVEGFAEFGRALYSGGADEETLAFFFPRSVKFFRDRGLMHGGQPQETQQAAKPKTPRELSEVSLMAASPKKYTKKVNQNVDLEDAQDNLTDYLVPYRVIGRSDDSYEIEQDFVQEATAEEVKQKDMENLIKGMWKKGYAFGDIFAENVAYVDGKLKILDLDSFDYIEDSGFESPEALLKIARKVYGWQ